MLDVVHRTLQKAPHGIGPTALMRLLVADGYPVPRRTSVVSYLEQLERMGIIDGDQRVLMDPLYPAYLLVDLPAPTEGHAREVLRTHEERLRALARTVRSRDKGAEQLQAFLAPASRIELAETQPGALLRTRATHAQVKSLRQDCINAGATSVHSFLVERSAA